MNPRRFPSATMFGYVTGRAAPPRGPERKGMRRLWMSTGRSIIESMGLEKGYWRKAAEDRQLWRRLVHAIDGKAKPPTLPPPTENLPLMRNLLPLFRSRWKTTTILQRMEERESDVAPVDGLSTKDRAVLQQLAQEELPYKCHLCQRVFRAQGSLTKHMNKEHSGAEAEITKRKLLSCDICGRGGFKDRSGLSHHMNLEHGDRGKCRFCAMELPLDRLARHEEACPKNPQLEWRCKKCGRLEVSKTALQSHMSKCDGEERRNPGTATTGFLCEKCGDRMKTQATFRVHQQTCHGRNCMYCGREAESSKANANHEKRCFRNPNRPKQEPRDPVKYPHQCPKCGDRFERSDVMKKHQQICLS